MDAISCGRDQLIALATFSANDVAIIKQRRHHHTQLGFGYQLAYVRVFNRFPTQQPLEVIDDILTFVALQLKLADSAITRYEKRQPTISEHQETIRHYMGLSLFNSDAIGVDTFVLKEAYNLEQTSALIASLRDFLKQNRMLEPSYDTMQRIIQTQREVARTTIYSRIYNMISDQHRKSLDALLTTDDKKYSPLYYLKQPPGHVSPAAFNQLTAKLEQIQTTGIHHIDMAWLNNNLQRNLARYARQCSLYRLKRLKEERRCAVLVCFLQQLYQDTFDAIVDMHNKLMNKVHNRADNEVNDYLKKRRRQIRVSLTHYKKILDILLNQEVQQESIRETIFCQIDQASLEEEKKPWSRY